VVALIALFWLFKIIEAYRLKQRMIHQAINEIEQAKNTEEIRTALHNLSQAKGWQANTTLQQLSKNWQLTSIAVACPQIMSTAKSIYHLTPHSPDEDVICCERVPIQI